jgi:AcrR family transcriptional regulator
MPSPRFRNLDPAKQAVILEAAAEEFATCEFEEASYNRVIERAGVSKGAMYYYFDSKEDLYQTVLQHMFERLRQSVAVQQQAASADEYWQRAERIYAAMLRFFQRDHTAAGLARGLIRARQRGQQSDSVERRERGLELMAAELTRGQGLGAVRKDVPANLLVGLTMAVTQGIYGWMAEHLGAVPEPELDAVAQALVGIYRRVLDPPEPHEADASALLKADVAPKI